MMIDVYEIAGRLQNENTLERRYRNHLRDVGLYDGPVEMGRIRLELVRTNVHELEDIVHLTYHTDEALRMAKEATRRKRDLLDLPSGMATNKDIRYGIHDALRELREPSTVKSEVEKMERAQKRIEHASMKRITGRYAGNRGGHSRLTQNENLMSGLEDLAEAMGLPYDTLHIASPSYNSSVARKIVRAGRYLLRTSARLEG